MFFLAFLISVYSYVIFLLGIFKVLTALNVLIVTIIFFCSGLIFLKKYIGKTNLYIEDKFERILVLILILQGVINIIGALGPELGFDALWYHLTLPKIYILNNAILSLKGGLFYYSDMPKLIEMFYIPALFLGNEIYAKLIHFSFGILTLIALYFLSRKFLSRTYSLLVLVIFYSNLVVGWESITAYIDLGRAFFEVMGLWAFINWNEKRSLKWLFISAVLIGCAVASKLIALGSVFIFIFLIIFLYGKRMNLKNTLISCIFFTIFSLLIAVPWFIFSYINTGNPLYPFFTSTYPVTTSHMIISIHDFLNLFLFSSDPINPLYLIAIPLIMLSLKMFKDNDRLILKYSVFALVVWFLTPRTGGGRFILPYLPAWSLLVGITLYKINDERFRKYFITLIIFIAVISIGYRGFANKKYIDVIIGKESKQKFLTENLNFKFGDFYDTDSYIKDHITKKDRILIIGGHNLYYVDVPFVHESYATKRDTFNYIMTISAELPPRYTGWKLIHRNEQTNTNFYKL